MRNISIWIHWTQFPCTNAQRWMKKNTKSSKTFHFFLSFFPLNVPFSLSIFTFLSIPPVSLKYSLNLQQFSLSQKALKGWKLKPNVAIHIVSVSSWTLKTKHKKGEEKKKLYPVVWQMCGWKKKKKVHLEHINFGLLWIKPWGLRVEKFIAWRSEYHDKMIMHSA